MDDLRAKYDALKKKFNYDTGHMSNSARANRHPAFAEILAMGKDAVKFILDDMDRYLQTEEDEVFPGAYGFKVLDEVTKVRMFYSSPGHIPTMAGEWIRWGETTGVLAKDRPKYKRPDPITYRGWIVVGRKRGEESVLCGVREPRNAFEEKAGLPAWVSKIDAARKVDDGWWCRYAWFFPNKAESEIALGILHERISQGECSEMNRPEKSWVEYVERTVQP